MSRFTILEAELPGKLGIGRAVLRLLRDELLIEGTDWELRDKAVWLTEPAAGKLQAGYARLHNGSLRALQEEAQPEVKKVAVNERGEAQSTQIPKDPNTQVRKLELKALIVTNTQSLSGKMIRAHLAGGELVRVRVQDSSKFCPGMTVYAYHVEGDVWQYHGPMPRWKGERLYRPEA